MFYLRLCVDVGIVSDEFLHHVCLSSQGSYVKGCVSFLFGKHEKLFKLLSSRVFLWMEACKQRRNGQVRADALKTAASLTF